LAAETPTELPAGLTIQPTTDSSLHDRRRQLAAARTQLAERESELAQFRALLAAFESRYFRQVGQLYAELDELEARIAEREAELYDSDAARQRAEEARARAQESHEAAFGEDREAEVPEPPLSLKALFRELAKRIHPDFARDEVEQKHFTLLMARANQAYARGDAEMLQRLLDDHREIHTMIAGEDRAAELERIARQIRHSQRDIANLEAEQHSLLSGEIGQLYKDAEAAAREHRDLLMELATKVRQQVADAKYRFEFVSRVVDRQIQAPGSDA